jgi:hypothetical protein
MSDFGPVSTLLQNIWRKDTRPLVDGQEKLALSREYAAGGRRPSVRSTGVRPRLGSPPKFLFLKFQTIH